MENEIKVYKLLRKTRNSKNIWKEIRKTNWRIECLKALLTSFVLLITSTGVLWFIAQRSPGEYTGDKLEKYLLKQVAEDVGISYNKDSIVLTRRLDTDRSVIKEDRIVLCGEYKSLDSDKIDRRFVYVFERSPEVFWNNLVRTKPRYETVFSMASQKCDETMLKCKACNFDDLNGDGVPEIIIYFLSKFADRSSKTYIILQNTDNGWQLVGPDFSNIQEETSNLVGVKCTVYLDNFSFYDPGNTEYDYVVVHGFPCYGDMYRVENPLWGGYDLLYCITVNDGTTGMLNADKNIYVMERLTESGMHRDLNWNRGKPLYVGIDDFSSQIDISTKWGEQYDDGVIFYGRDSDE